MKKIQVQNQMISVRISKDDDDYISLTDMAKFKDYRAAVVISNWLSAKYTIQFIGGWEQIHNPTFKVMEFNDFRNDAGSNGYVISPSVFVAKTNAVGIKSSSGRYGGTFAHKDIAFEFATWLSPEFKLYLIKEFQRLKIEENKKLALGWDARRLLTKLNYKIHTDSIKENIVLPLRLSAQEAIVIYANEADVLNKALFGLTAQEWGENNPDKEGNIRDYTDVYRLVVLANLESLNAEYIRQGLAQGERLLKLNEIAIYQMKSLIGNRSMKKIESSLKTA